MSTFQRINFNCFQMVKLSIHATQQLASFHQDCVTIPDTCMVFSETVTIHHLPFTVHSFLRYALCDLTWPVEDPAMRGRARFPGP
jgi:hypothetical protein